VKNQNLGFTIPYVLEGDARSYYPDFIARVSIPNQERVINLIIEVSGEKRKDKAAKVETANALWVPSVNNHGGFGEWAFVEISDPWNAQFVFSEFFKDFQLNGEKTQNANK
jgi:type III restriction enzyme